MSDIIQLRHPEKKEWPVLRKIWCEAFPEDADGFCDFFLSRVTEPEFALTAVRSGRMESQMFLLPCRHLCYGAVQAEYRYVYAAGTRLDSRGHHYLKALLQEAVRISEAEGKNGICVTSAPELEGTYERYGCRRGGLLYETKFCLKGRKALDLDWQDCSYETCRILRHRYLCSLPSAVEWVGDTDRLFFDDAKNSGRVLTACIDGRQYYAVCMKREDGWILRETDFPLESGLYASLGLLLGCDELTVQSRTAFGKGSSSCCYCHYLTAKEDPSLSEVYLNLIPE